MCTALPGLVRATRPFFSLCDTEGDSRWDGMCLACKTLYGLPLLMMAYNAPSVLPRSYSKRAWEGNTLEENEKQQHTQSRELSILSLY